MSTKSGKSSAATSVKSTSKVSVQTTTRNESSSVNDNARKKKPPPPFNAKDPKYMCCCHDIRIASIFFGSGSLLSAVAIVILGIFLTDWTVDTQTKYISFAVYCARIPALICLIIGAFKKKQALIFIYIIYGCFAWIGYGMAAVGFCVNYFIITKEHYIPTGEVYNFIGNCFESVFAAMYTWMAFKCYRYLHHLKAANSQTFDTRNETEV